MEDQRHVDKIRRLLNSDLRLSRPAAAKGVLRSIPFRLEKPRLTWLQAARGIGRAYLQVKVGDEVVARGPRLRQRRLHLQRVDLDLSAWVGRDVVIELIDGDERGELAIDDLRLTD